jgi:arsenite/tail-anchored protein-transporting ATPase
VTRYSFFAGKGGVGKTTCSAAFALSLRGRALLVSTDPAHSLGDALQMRLTASPRRVRGSLFAVELDADRALARWLKSRERAFRTIAARGTYLDDEDIDALFRLSLPGVDELVALIELTRLAKGFDEVVVDTAPTGHTLRLLETPATLRRLAAVFDDLSAKHRAMAAALRGTVRRDAEDAVIEELQTRARELQDLLSSSSVAIHWVFLPEALPLSEARSGVEALQASGMNVARLIANRVTPAPRGACALCSSRRYLESAVLREAAKLGLPMVAYPEIVPEPRGARSLGQMTKKALRTPVSRVRRASAFPGHLTKDAEPRAIDALLSSDLRLLLVGGKGGVGKSTAASAAALHAARSGREVLLLSTDPAHSLGELLRLPIGDEEREVQEGLHARELDAPRNFAARRQQYRDDVDELFAALRGGSSFDAPFDRVVIEDLIDLAPPGLDEIFALLAVVDALPRYQLIVVDTAPTGHALRLLEMVPKAREWVQVLLQILLKYRRVVGLGQLARELTETARQLRELEELLHDPLRTSFLVVTRAAELPRLETERLLAFLRRLEISAPAVLVNALTPKGCRRCAGKCAAEGEALRKLKPGRGWVMLGAGAAAPPPRGVKALLLFGRTWTRMR